MGRGEVWCAKYPEQEGLFTTILTARGLPRGRMLSQESRLQGAGILLLWESCAL